MDPVATASQVVETRFPSALSALLAGSAARGRTTSTSDLDVLVLVPDIVAPRRETVEHDGWPLELFVHTRASFDRFVARERAERRSPLLHMAAEGRVLVDRDGSGVRLQHEAAIALEEGPTELTQEEREDRRYQLTDLIDDLRGSEDRGESVFVGTRLLLMTAELALLQRCQWLGRGKWLLRRLRATDPGVADELLEGLRALVVHGEVDRLVRISEAVLDDAGGRLTTGYRRVVVRGGADATTDELKR